MSRGLKTRNDVVLVDFLFVFATRGFVGMFWKFFFFICGVFPRYIQKVKKRMAGVVLWVSRICVLYRKIVVKTLLL